MSAKLSFVKKILDDENINSYQLILKALFGTNTPCFYNESKVYNKGDVILVVVDGAYELRMCNSDNVTGPFNEEKWQATLHKRRIQSKTIGYFRKSRVLKSPS